VARTVDWEWIPQKHGVKPRWIVTEILWKRNRTSLSSPEIWEILRPRSIMAHQHKAAGINININIASVGIRVCKEPTGIYRDSVKRRRASPQCHGSQAEPWPGMSRLQPHWQIPTSQLLLFWAETKPSSKEVIWSPDVTFPLIAVETLGLINESAVDFLRELGEGGGAGSPPSSRRSDRLLIYSRCCQSLCSDIQNDISYFARQLSPRFGPLPASGIVLSLQLA